MSTRSGRPRGGLRFLILGLCAAVVAGLALGDASAQGSTAATARGKLTVIAPAAPGGGWDGFGREAQRAMRANGIVNTSQVVNVPGAGGTIGLSQLVRMHGREDILMVTGAVMIGAVELSSAPESLADVTPVARLADDFSALVVPAGSPIQTVQDFARELASNPGGTSIAGGSLGGIDHLLAGMLGRAVGVDPREVNYVAYSGGGEVLTALLSNTTTGAISGYNELRDQVETGALRVLAISAAERLPGEEVPTFLESGLDVQMSNWRGFVAPPGISEEAREELIEIVTELAQTPEWLATLERNSWENTFTAGAEFAEFLTREQSRVDALITELGL